MAKLNDYYITLSLSMRGETHGDVLVELENRIQPGQPFDDPTGACIREINISRIVKPKH